MIKVIGSSEENVNFTVIYNQSARVLNIESSSMCDDCIPYEESTGCMVWVDKSKTPCEIECIFPVVTENLGNWMSNDIKLLEGTPRLKVSFEEKPIEIVFNHSQLILIFNKDRIANKKYISSNIAFYVSDDELVAIVCTNFKII